MTQTPIKLPYSPPIPWYRTWRVQRRFIATVTVLAVIAAVVVGVTFGPKLYREAATAYWRNRCMSYSAPPNQVVLTTDPSEIATLLASGSVYSVDRRPDGHAVERPVTVRPAIPLQRLRECWVDDPDPLPPIGTAFLQPRQWPGGPEVLVVVDVWVGAKDEVCFYASVLWPPSHQTRRGVYSGPAHFELRETQLAPRLAADDPRFTASTRPARSLRIFAGQPDLTNASRFSIRYEYDGQEGYIDGYVGDKRDGVILWPRRKGQQPMPWPPEPRR